MDALGAFLIAGLLVLLLAGLCLCYAVGADASARGSNGVAWGLASFVFPPAVVVYLVYRTRLQARTKPATAGERWIGSVGIGGVSANVISATVVPPDPVTTVVSALLLALVFVPTIAVCWARFWSSETRS